MTGIFSKDLIKYKSINELRTAFKKAYFKFKKKY